MKGWLASVPRPDLEAPTRVRAASAAPQQQQHAKQLFSASHGMSLGGHGSGPVLDFKFHECTEQRWARVPTFSYDAAQRRTNVAVRPQPVPRLDYQTILRVKQQALADAPFQHRRLHDDLTWRGGAKRHSARQSNAFLHPGGYVGPGELAVMAARLASGAQPQSAAKESLLTVSREKASWEGRHLSGQLKQRLLTDLSYISQHPTAIHATTTITTNPGLPQTCKTTTGPRRAAQGVPRLVRPHRDAARRLRRPLPNAALRGGLRCVGARRIVRTASVVCMQPLVLPLHLRSISSRSQFPPPPRPSTPPTSCTHHIHARC